MQACLRFVDEAQPVRDRALRWLSKGAASYRKTAAELVQRHPEVLAALREGKLCMTSLVELAKVLTTENCAEVLPRFFHVSRSEAKEVTAALLPAAAPPFRRVVTAVRRRVVLNG